MRVKEQRVKDLKREFTTLTKTDKMEFLRLKAFFVQQNMCVSILFKAESEQKHEAKFFWGGFSSKTKNLLFRGSIIVVKT